MTQNANILIYFLKDSMQFSSKKMLKFLTALFGSNQHTRL